MLRSFNPEMIMPLVIFWIPWFMAVSSLRSHYRNGTMTAYLRRSSEVDDDGPESYSTSTKEHPISYRLLFVFYWFVAVAVPVATAVVLWGS